MDCICRVHIDTIRRLKMLKEEKNVDEFDENCKSYRLPVRLTFMMNECPILYNLPKNLNMISEISYRVGSHLIVHTSKRKMLG